MSEQIFKFFYLLRHSRYFPYFIGVTLGIVVLAGTWGVYSMMNQKPREISLRVWGYWEPEVIQPLIAEYRVSHPHVTVQYEKRELDRYRETVQNRIQNGLGPDIFYFQSRWLPMLQPVMVPLPDSVMNSQTFDKTFLPIASRELSAYNKLWGLPTKFEGLALLYNNELFKSVGLSGAPISWDELRIKYVPMLTVKDRQAGLQTAGIALGTGQNIAYVSEIVQLMMAQNGTTFTKDGELTLQKSLSTGTPARNLGLDALSFYTSFAQDDQATWSADFPDSLEAFTNGKVGMIFARNDAIPGILQLSHEFGTPLDLKVAPVPQLPARSEVTWGTTWSLGVSSLSKEAPSAWDFVKFVSNKQSAQKILTAQRSSVPVADIPVRLDSIDLVKTDPYLGPFAQQAKSAISFYGVERTLDKGLNDAMSLLFRELVTSIQISEQAFDAIAGKMADLLGGYGIVTPIVVTPETF